jgi:hypothetical protein
MPLKSLACVAVLLAGASVAFAQKQITLLATVTSPTGDPIATIEPASVQVLENGVRAKVVKVEPVDRKRKVHLLIDNGVGLPSEGLADLRKGLHGLLAVVPEGVEVSVVTTAPQPRVVERGTSDKTKAGRAIDLIAPDRGAGRFVEALFEASDRIDRDKESTNVVVVLATTSGDMRVRDGDMATIGARASGGRMKVHVVMFMGRTGTSFGGGAQLDLGQGVTKTSGGRFEQINVTSRLATLLPEIGADIGKTMGVTARQYRFIADRPPGTSGDFGKLSLAIDGLLVSSVNVEAR